MEYKQVRKPLMLFRLCCNALVTFLSFRILFNYLNYNFILLYYFFIILFFRYYNIFI